MDVVLVVTNYSDLELGMYLEATSKYTDSEYSVNPDELQFVWLKVDLSLLKL